MIMRNFIIVTALFIGLGLTCLGGPLPKQVASKVDRLDFLFKDSSASRYRVGLMVIPKNRFIDPPPNSRNFALAASATITISSHACYPEIRSLIDGFRSADYQISQSPGYPHWEWFLMDGDDVQMSVLVDDENRLIDVNGSWYRVPDTLIKRLVESFAKVSCKLLSGHSEVSESKGS
jgi:hypothetical protein